MHGYSGDDLNGQLATGQIAQSIVIYAHDHQMKVDIPYIEVSGVRNLASALRNGTFAFPESSTFSTNSRTPVVVFTTGEMAAIGYSDGKAVYFKAGTQPPWYSLNRGFTGAEALVVLSVILNIVMAALLIGKLKAKKPNY